MRKIILFITISIILNSCYYPYFYNSVNTKNIIRLDDSTTVSLAYQEHRQKYIDGNISILVEKRANDTVIVKLDSTQIIKSKFYNAKLKRGLGNYDERFPVISFNEKKTELSRLYFTGQVHKKMNAKDRKEYFESQKVFISPIIISFKGKEYIMEGLEFKPRRE
jgi:hypothetical protein